MKSLPYLIAFTSLTLIGCEGSSSSNDGNNNTDNSDTRSITVEVPGSGNLYIAGSEEGVFSGNLPVAVVLPEGTARTLRFTRVTGSVDFGGSTTIETPEGIVHDGQPYGERPSNGVVDDLVPTVLRRTFLGGVFLDSNNPSNKDGTPIDYSLSSPEFTVGYLPGLAQGFFIGDGKTSYANTHIFDIPDASDTLYLGTDDSVHLDNRGSFFVEIEFN